MVFVSSCFWLHLTKMQFKSSLSNKEQVLAYHFCMFKMCGSPQVYILKIPQQTVKKTKQISPNYGQNGGQFFIGFMEISQPPKSTSPFLGANKLF